MLFLKFIFLQYNQNKDLSGKHKLTIKKETIINIIKIVLEIYLYGNTNYLENFKSINILNEFKFPIKIIFLEVISLKNIIKL